MLRDEHDPAAKLNSMTLAQLTKLFENPTPEQERAIRNALGEDLYETLLGLAPQRSGRARGGKGSSLDERAFIRRIESADTEELAEILLQPTVDQERVLRIHLGDERFQRMHALALGKASTRSVPALRGNVVFIPGIMGSELTAFDHSGTPDPIWLNVLRIVAGRLDRLRLDEKGLAGIDHQYDVRASGILKRYYGELLLTLSRHWRVRAYWFDWRKDINIAAEELASKITGWFGSDAPVHIVAHSMGGLVARTFLANNPERWKQMAKNGKGGRLVMLGTPNYGSYYMTQGITGAADIVRKLAKVDIWNGLDDILDILNTFVGTYQMLPSPHAPGVDPEILNRLYDARTYAPRPVPQHHLDNARRFHDRLAAQKDYRRMVYVAGCNQPTAVGIQNIQALNSLDGYTFSNVHGDGSVPHALGLIEGVDTYYVDAEHSELPGHVNVLNALNDLLVNGSTTSLDRSIPPRKTGWFRGEGPEPDPRTEVAQAWERDEEDLEHLSHMLRTRGKAPDGESYVGPQERLAEEILVRRGAAPQSVTEGPQRAAGRIFPPAKIEVGIACAGIDTIDTLGAAELGSTPVDVVAVGHYIGVTPTAAEKALDRAITRAFYGLSEKDPDPEDRKLVLTQYTERGTIRGELGQPFFLADPRKPAGKGTPERLIVLAGMGLPGRFGAPELVVLVRELCWRWPGRGSGTWPPS